MFTTDTDASANKDYAQRRDVLDVNETVLSKDDVEDRFALTTIGHPGRGKSSAHATAFHQIQRNMLVAVLAALAAFAWSIVGLDAKTASAAAGTNTLWANETLATNQSLWSPSHTYQLLMQSDGNLVVYGPGGPTWSSNTRGNNARLVMQPDNNLVVYSDSGILFATGTNGNGSNRLVMQDDGNLVLYGGSWIWASKNPSERAIQWFYNRIGWTNYEGKCELAVENAFGTSGQYSTAGANWNARTKHYPYTAAPRGALVFFNTSSSGHVAISLGNGKILSTSAGGRIGTVSISYFQNPLGWAWAPW
jgi:hypothetical protein